MFFYFLWEAMLISYVASPKDIQPFNSLEEFLLNTNKKVISYSETYFSDQMINMFNIFDNLIFDKILFSFAALRSQRNSL